MIRYCLTILVGAFLLFQVQPLIGKYILPWFGGGPAIWTTCLLFFQSLLLLGYAFAHAIARWCSPRAQCVMYCLTLVATLIVLPITPRSAWKPIDAADPTWHILLLLLSCVGAPCLLLSATLPLVQTWFSRTHVGTSPYRLYALSNIGSLLGLLTYPVLVEPFLRLKSQVIVWSGAYVAFVLLSMSAIIQLLARRVVPMSPAHSESGTERATELRISEPTSTAETPPSIPAALLWLSLACCGSVILLATTNVMCRDIAPIPLLWVLPLALYLLSFIVCFGHEHWYKRELFGVLLIAAVGTQVALYFYRTTAPLTVQIAQYSFLLTICCFICHGELVRLKPSARFLTQFYLVVSAGGALGGVLVTLVAPALFPDYYEFHGGIVACCLLLLVMYRVEVWKCMDHDALRAEARRVVLRVAVVLAAVILSTWGLSSLASPGERSLVIAQQRNFYGALSVFLRFADDSESRQMVMAHGTTEHGFQFQDEGRRQVPTSYYAKQSGIGVAIRNHPRYVADRQALRLGVIGLGTGTLACYARDGDYLRFYELDPLVVELSEKHFTFQEDARRRGVDLDVYLGDARIVMERQLAHIRPEQFDILAVDAFSSDSIPMHLLTWECFEIYTRHVRQDGIIAFHISNRHIDLSPVVRKFAERSGMQALYMRLRPKVSQDTSPAEPAGPSDWILVTNNEQFIHNDAVQNAHTPWRSDARPAILWTDDFSNLLQLLWHDRGDEGTQ